MLLFCLSTTYTSSLSSRCTTLGIGNSCGYSAISSIRSAATFLYTQASPEMRFKRKPFIDSIGSLHTSISKIRQSSSLYLCLHTTSNCCPGEGECWIPCLSNTRTASSIISSADLDDVIDTFSAKRVVLGSGAGLLSFFIIPMAFLKDVMNAFNEDCRGDLGGWG